MLAALWQLPACPWSGSEIAIIVVVMCVGATIQGSIGFGMNLLGAPILLLIDPVLVPGPILVAAICLGILLAHRDRRGIDITRLGWGFAGRVPGALAGIAALSLLSQHVLTLTFGSLVLAAVAMSASGLSLRPSRGSVAAAGMLSGFMSVTASIGGPPMALVYQDSKGGVLRGTLSSHFVTGASLSVALLALSGHFGGRELAASAVLIPGMLVGYLISARTAPILDRGYIRPGVLALAALAGASVIIRELWG